MSDGTDSFRGINPEIAAEIFERLDDLEVPGFAGHKDDLIKCLRDACASCELEEATAWQDIERTAVLMRTMRAMGGDNRLIQFGSEAPPRTPRRQLRQGAEHLAADLGNALAALEKMFKREPDLAREFLGAWAWNANRGADTIVDTQATAAEVQLPYDGLVALKAAADRVVEWHPKPRAGRLPGAAKLPPENVCVLAACFERTTGRLATPTDTGPFFVFVQTFATALNIELSDDGLTAAIKKGLRRFNVERKSLG